MDSREIVLRSLAFSCPARIPMTLPSPYPHDIVHAGLAPSGDPEVGVWMEIDGKWRMRDEWGNTWSRLEGFSKGEVIHGAIEEDWALLDSYRWPDIDNRARFEAARQWFAGHPDQYHLGSLPGFPFAIARYMRRMEVFLADVLVERERATALLQRIADLLEGTIAGFAAAGADGAMLAEDWGTQDRLLVSPATWREVFKPGFRQLCDAARKHGITVWMHSCGHIYEIIGDLVEVGVSVLQFDQPALHGIDNLASDFGGKVNFWCPVDIQQTLQTQDAAVIEAAARELVEKLGGYGGGFIAGYYGSNEAIGLDPCWQDIACQAFVKYGARPPCRSAAG
ncbi:MAG: uroporphyrinogen decarboxylase family protein [Anaerolineae bacterium]